MHEEFILEGSMRQVNLPSNIASKATAGVEEASASGEAPPLDLFEQASAEVFKLMERDTYSRFKRDDESIKKLVASFHREAGLGEGESNVTFEKFSTWAKANPSVMAEARQSYPSGHASIAFSGLSCLAMYLRNKLCIVFADTADTRRATPRLLLLALAVFLPLVVAATIAASRTRDHHHNFSDINAGAAIGLGVAAAVYHLFLPSSPAPPRSGAAACAAQSGNDQEAYGQSSPLL